ncbi:MAG: lysophospholipid acyltransferase family protein [candidate division WOR-3 bacterium]
MKARWRLGWVLTYPGACWLFGLRVSGREWLGLGPQIIAANHTSNFDPLIVGWACAREVHFLAKEELFRVSRLFGWLIRFWNAHPVRRDGADTGAVRLCSRLLQEGQTVVLFPEGTRSPNGALQPFKPGIGMLAILNRVPVVPMHIAGMAQSLISYWVDRDIVRKGYRAKPRLNLRSLACPLGQVRVRFGEPVMPLRFLEGRPGYEALTQEVEARVRRLAEQDA